MNLGGREPLLEPICIEPHLRSFGDINFFPWRGSRFEGGDGEIAEYCEACLLVDAATEDLCMQAVHAVHGGSLYISGGKICPTYLLVQHFDPLTDVFFVDVANNVRAKICLDADVVAPYISNRLEACLAVGQAMPENSCRVFLTFAARACYVRNEIGQVSLLHRQVSALPDEGIPWTGVLVLAEDAEDCKATTSGDTVRVLATSRYATLFETVEGFTTVACKNLMVFHALVYETCLKEDGIVNIQQVLPA
jgi:hypothetical protein